MLLHIFRGIAYSKKREREREGGRATFMMKKRRRMMKTLTRGCSHTEERPRPGGTGDPEILVQVKLSKRELIHSLGISCQKEQTHKENIRQ